MSDQVVQIQLAEPWATLLLAGGALIMTLAIIGIIYLTNRLLDYAEGRPVNPRRWREADEQ